MQQIIGSVRLETAKPIKVIEINVFPVLLTLVLVVAAFFTSIYISNIRAEQVAETAHVDTMIAIAIERVYAEAQIDALEGRVRVAPTADGSYVWVDSPWSDGTAPRFRNVADYRGTND